MTVNPLAYPASVLIGAIALVVGIRVARLPSVIMLPTSAAIATAGAMFQQSRQPQGLERDNPALAREVKSIRAAAVALATSANTFRAEAARLLAQPEELDLLSTIQSACDRATELPTRIDELARRLQGQDALLSVQDLQAQLSAVQTRLQTSSGPARAQLSRLATTLQRNLQLARQGQDTRQAQVLSLSTLIADTAGVLQQMQNQLRTADLSDRAQTEDLRSLSNELRLFQDQVDRLTGA